MTYDKIGTARRHAEEAIARLEEEARALADEHLHQVDALKQALEVAVANRDAALEALHVSYEAREGSRLAEFYDDGKAKARAEIAAQFSDEDVLVFQGISDDAREAYLDAKNPMSASLYVRQHTLLVRLLAVIRPAQASPSAATPARTEP